MMKVQHVTTTGATEESIHLHQLHKLLTETKYSTLQIQLLSRIITSSLFCDLWRKGLVSR